MTLLERVQQRPEPVPLLISSKLVVDLVMLRQTLGRREGWLRSIAQEGVALAIRSPIDLALALIALDGRCHRLLLLPDGLTGDEVLHFMQRCYCSVLLNDAGWKQCAQSGAGGEAGAINGQHQTEWFMPTSGTTGTPKLVRHSLASLTRTTKTGQAAGSPIRWGQMYAIPRFAGMQVLLQSLLGGSSLVLGDADDNLDTLLALFERSGVNAISATPTQWRTLLMLPAAGRLDLGQITLGGEIATQTTLDALRQKFPRARISHVYASTETGVGFSVTDGLEGFPARWLDQPERGLAIDPDSGELLISGSRLPTGDAVARRGARVLFAGRLNGSINVGGNKVMPETVERVLLACPGVAAALARGRKSALTGNLVVADIVMREPVTDRAEQIRVITQHCAKWLQRHEIPALVNFVSELKTGSSGKVLRHE